MFKEMYFMRLSTPMDDSTSDYMSVGMADTGTRRHEAIQDAKIFIRNRRHMEIH